jgi:hypothetical protein
MLVDFKFELNMCVATGAALPSVWLLFAQGRVQGATASWITVGLVAASLGFYAAARGTAEVLATLREKLVSGVGEPPFDDAGSPRIIPPK